jgi:Cys-rich protein (TIGR01571 family)
MTVSTTTAWYLPVLNMSAVSPGCKFSLPAIPSQGHRRPLQPQVLTSFPHSLQFIKRGELREKYNIKGDQMTDCLYSAFCHCCVLIQQEKEIIARQSAAGQTQGYAAPQGMSAVPQ